MSYQLIIDCLFLAVAGGLIYGIFGSGSGLVMTPGYYYVLRHFAMADNHQMQIAIATTAAASALLGSVAAKAQWQANNIDFKAAKKVAPGIAVGTLVAVLLLNVIPSEFLKHLFGVVVIFVAGWLWVYRQDKDHKHWSLVKKRNHLMSGVIGLLWFLLGIAVFTVPYLHKCRISIRRSVGTATFIGAIFSGFASILLMVTGAYQIGINHTQIGYVNLLLLAVSVVPSAYAAHVGSKLSHKLPQKHLKQIYAVLIFIVGALMVY